MSRRVESIGLSTAIKGLSVKIRQAISAIDCPSRKGVYSSLWARNGVHSRVPLATFVVGEEADKAERHHDFAEEKAGRLISHLSDGHTTSHESRDPEKDQFGGAILGDFYVLSISGFATEEEDTAVALLAALELGLLSRRTARKIARIGGATKILARLEESCNQGTYRSTGPGETVDLVIDGVAPCD